MRKWEKVEEEEEEEEKTKNLIKYIFSYIMYFTAISEEL